jgi:hypothetical protein
MRARLLLGLLAFLACGGDAAESHAGSADLSWVPRYFSHFDSVAVVAGLPALRDHSTAGRELRVWHDRGSLFAPHALLRLRQGDDGLTGQYLLWWPLDPDRTDTEWPAQVEVEVRDWYRCARVMAPDTLPVCEVPVAVATDWQRLLRELETLGVETLPDESQLAPPDHRWILDGETLVVEVRRGDRYRTYHYHSPGARAWPQAVQASGILRVMHELLDQARKSP